MKKLLETRNLKKYFRTPRGMLYAVDNVSFVIKEGETLGVVGESGCGKSTLGRCVVRLHDVTDGQVWYKEKEISRLSRKDFRDYRRDMQMIFQDPFSSLNPRMSVSQIIAEPLIIHKMCANSFELGRKVGELMDTVGLARRLASSYPHELDGGRRQRIGIARALSLNPRFIVCDEPVSALDVSIQAQILNLMQDLQEELRLTYMFITHNISVVKHISNNIMVMYMGTVVELAPSPDVFRYRMHPYTKALLDAAPIPDPDKKRRREPLKGEITSPIDLPAGCRFAKRCVYASGECFSSDPLLKEYRPGHFTACHNTEKINEL
ncbi:MAG: ATP-binding cassette domain-containing protein [Synergistaceae bacterium]|jgi:peptide/nickel transport system ATP-binding protein|nr:ATP-binding cassette domain-containing protein [Synergistaceae bacterium]